MLKQLEQELINLMRSEELKPYGNVVISGVVQLSEPAPHEQTKRLQGGFAREIVDMMNAVAAATNLSFVDADDFRKAYNEQHILHFKTNMKAIALKGLPIKSEGPVDVSLFMGMYGYFKHWKTINAARATYAIRIMWHPERAGASTIMVVPMDDYVARRLRGEPVEADDYIVYKGYDSR